MQTNSDRAAEGGTDGKRREQAEPIAIIGMAGRFPGSPDIDTFWDQLRAGTDAISEVPRDRYDVEAIFEPSPSSPGRTSSKWGGFLERIQEFDPEFFGISPREASRMDPQQRLLLETTYDALEDAGQDLGRIGGSNTGVYMGQLGGDYWHMQYQNPQDLEFYGLIGAAARAMTSGRVAYSFDFRGPSVTLDTACSSSLTAVHMAAQSIRSGETTMAVAGAANVVLLPEEGTVYSGARMLASDGRCKFGDASADGFVRSDGVGVVILKSLSQARADGDRVRAVILGSAIGNDGQSSGYLVTPGVEGQRDVLLRAYEQAGISPAEIDYLEAHGTGTSVGDKVELEVFGQVLGQGRPVDQPCLVGSSKTNIGHAEAAAGMAGLIKTVLSLEHGAVPANLHQNTPNPAIPWDTLPVRLPSTYTPLPDRGRPHRAGVSSFGLTGANAHVVLSAPEPRPAQKSGSAEKPGTHLLALSAVGPEALMELAGAWADVLDDEGPSAPSLQDLTYSALQRRSHFDCRLAMVVASRGEAAAILREFAEDGEAHGSASALYVEEERPRVVFVFPGQGSQWIGMGRQLLATEPVFERAMRACDGVISHENGWSVIELLNSDDTERFARVDVIQPTLWAMEIALAELWRSWGVEPDVVIGHSMGEAAAAYISGALSLADAGAVICRRSRMARRLSGHGTMAWVEQSAQQASEAIAGYENSVAIAAANSPTSTLLSGDRQALEEILAKLDEQDVFNRWINVDYASHGPQMDAIRADLLSELKQLSPQAGTIPLHSTLLGETIDGSQMDAEYWARNIREPVNFVDAVRTQLDTGNTVFVEISPHPVLASAIAATAEAHGQPSTAVGSLRRDDDERESLLTSVAKLYTANVAFDWEKVTGGGRFVPLPRYPWQRVQHWIEETQEPTSSDGAPAEGLEETDLPPGVVHTHPLLGATVPAPSGTRTWQGPIDRARNAYLDDHQVQGSVIFPGTAYIELAAAAAAEIHGDAPVSVRDIRYREALFLDEGAAEVRVTLTLTGSAPEYSLQVHSQASSSSPWVLHAEATVSPCAVPADTAEAVAHIRSRAGRHQDKTVFYPWHAARGNQWNGAFQAVEDVWMADGEALARLAGPSSVLADWDAHRFHPAVLDAAAHSLVAARPDIEEGQDHAFVLGGIDQVRIFRRPGTQLWSHCVLKPEAREDSFTGDVRILDETGALVADMTGLRLQYLQGHAPTPLASAPDADEEDEPGDWLYELQWTPAAPLTTPAVQQDGTWVVLTDSGHIGRNVVKGLQRMGQRVVVVTAARGYATTGADRHRVDPASRDDLAKILMETSQDSTIRGIVHMWSLDATVSGDANDAEIQRAEDLTCRSAVHLSQALAEAHHDRPPRLWLVTRSAQLVQRQDRVKSPFQAPIWGLGRTLAIEHPDWQTSLVDLDDAPSSVDALLTHLLHADGESQVCLRDGRRLAARLVRKEVGAVEAAGAPAGHVVIEVSHGGIGAGDANRLTDPAFMWGCAGVVAAVGDGADGVVTGDTVLALVRGPLAGTVTVPASVVVSKPAHLTAAQAATLPRSFVTAYRALHDVARVATSERVAVDDTTGELADAAAKVATALGSTVVSSEARDLDVLVTSGSGRKNASTARQLRPGGRYVDCSATFGSLPGHLSAEDFSHNRAFHTVELAELFSRAPQELGTALRRVCELAERGVLRTAGFTELSLREAQAVQGGTGSVVVALSEHTAHESDAEKADFSVFAHATYLVTGGLGGIGGRVASWLADRGARHLLLTGRTALPPLEEWGSLLPTDPGYEQVSLLRSLARRGVEVEYAAVDTADFDSMRMVLAEREAADLPRLRGVLHVAGTIDYTLVRDLESPQISAALHSKVSGAWALHRLTREQRLDFFVLFSSGSALLGSPLLGAYAAGNAFLDALAHYRLQSGQAASVVNWGFWGGVGMMARKAQEDERDVVPQGMQHFTPSQGLAVLEHLLQHQCDQAAVLRVDWPVWAQAYPALASTPQFRGLAQGEAGPLSGKAPVAEQRVVTSSPAASAAVQPAVREPASPVRKAARSSPVVTPASPVAPAAGTGVHDGALLEELTATVASVLKLPTSRVKPTTPLKRMGLDSLMAVELRARIERTHQTDIPVTLLLKGGTLNKIIDHIGSNAPPIPTADQVRVPTPTKPISAAPAPVKPRAVEPTPKAPVTAAVKAEPAPPTGTDEDALLEELTATVASVLKLPTSRVKPTTPLKRMGLDSLMAVELRARIERTHQTDIPVTLLLKGGTLNKIIDHIGSNTRDADTEGAEL
ncbi:acyltransferase domain-containing protein [Streptomyces sp. NBC_01808]|uniref:polyketide synthase n=1 Tax=Streptomyces sp. NBC_01808 TaxID=2975947 RepID=UPI002DDA933B|nr:polyketide synthase [Streptomyces sp. NBC_01808]WSA41532.1 acyltransferase domain-containing protein [Streptomyces sp. NBC_01808]